MDDADDAAAPDLPTAAAVLAAHRVDSADSPAVVLPPSPEGPPPAPTAPDPAVAGARFGLDKLGESAGTKTPYPVFTWVAGIVYCIAADPEISGGDDSLTGITMAPTYLSGGNGSETGLMLRFSQQKGPKGDLICRIARKFMELKGKKDDLFDDWEALRKHLCDNKRLGPAEHFSFLWTGKRRGGHESGDHSQKYYERRFTAELASEKKLTREQVNALRKEGGGGNPGLLAHCGSLLQQCAPGLYTRAKEAALAEVAIGLQVKTFEERHKAAQARFSAALVKQSENTRKFLAQKGADTRNNEKYITLAASVQQSSDMIHWVEHHPEAVARSYLASEQFTTEQIEQIETLFEGQPRCFSVNEVHFFPSQTVSSSCNESYCHLKRIQCIGADKAADQGSGWPCGVSTVYLGGITYSPSPTFAATCCVFLAPCCCVYRRDG